ncbi:hypothetical protein AX16_008963 [Volvariella volvacea WC 439]|nr:hypothetical protein AX16_008963 [Volvariella volvacea WC 439]
MSKDTTNGEPKSASDDEFTILSVSPTPSEFSTIENADTVAPTTRKTTKEEAELKLNPHEKYFFEDGNLLVRVEGVDFKVHRYFFMRDSPVVRQISKEGTIGRILDGGIGCSTGGHTSPLILEDLKSVDFERFLSILYPTDFDKDEDTTSAYWSSILDVSSKLTFQSIRSLSIKKLSIVGLPVDKIALGRKFDITHWLREAYRNVCTRKDTLTKEEGRKLGVDEVVGIMEGRQLMFSKKMEAKDQNKVLDKLFKLTN